MSRNRDPRAELLDLVLPGAQIRAHELLVEILAADQPAKTELVRIMVRHQYPIVLHQYHDGRYQVTYGADVRARPTLRAALVELNGCLEHALGCLGLFDGEEDQ